VREKVNSARDARARRGNLSVPLDAWARCGANGVSSLTLADVCVMGAAASKSDRVRRQFFLELNVGGGESVHAFALIIYLVVLSV
jgi:hypothetical protein